MNVKKPRRSTMRPPRLLIFKRPVDCDDEESLEERRGRTVLRTAMVSTLAYRNYGPPDGIQPEFDLLLTLHAVQYNDGLLYRPLKLAAAVELLATNFEVKPQWE